MLRLVTGHRLLTDANVMSALAAGKEKQAAQTKITQDDVLHMLEREATAGDFAKPNTARIRAIELLAKIPRYADRQGAGGANRPAADHQRAVRETSPPTKRNRSETDATQLPRSETVVYEYESYIVLPGGRSSCKSLAFANASAAGRQALLTRITLLGTVPNLPRCAWCTHPMDHHGPYGCNTFECRCGRTGS